MKTRQVEWHRDDFPRMSLLVVIATVAKALTDSPCYRGLKLHRATARAHLLNGKGDIPAESLPLAVTHSDLPRSLTGL